MIKPYNNYDEIIYTDAPTMYDELSLNPIPNNIILNKVITGWGATHVEIKSMRNSIILVPNKCQIENKLERYKAEVHIYGVSEKYTVKQLIKHIEEANGSYIKFLSTPEGLHKLIEAILTTGGNPYTDYFILTDESHKLTMDISYRVNISSSMDHFFNFKNKAMISATPFIPSDPRFQFFKKVKVQHKREIQKKIDLKIVNNISSAFKEYIDTYDGEMLFVFFNSLNGIHSLITKLELHDIANVYCSEDGVEDFNIKEFKRAYNVIDPKLLGRINFLTSSFYNGLDIKGFPEIPDVVILSDIQFVKHSIVDPNTDVYQILGRFRPDDPFSMAKDRYRTATHIVKTHANAGVKLEDRAIHDFNESAKRYRMLQDLQATTIDMYLKYDVYGEALKRVTPYFKLLNKAGDLDHFKYDNYLYEYRLKMCYCQELAISFAYIYSNLFDFTETKKIYAEEDLITMTKGMNRYSPQNIKMVIEKLINNEKYQGVEGSQEYYEDLKKRYPLIVKAVEVLGYDIVWYLGTKSKIEKELRKISILDDKNSQGMIDAVYSCFLEGYSYEVSKVKTKLQKLFQDYEISATAKATDINTYYEVQEYTGHKKLTAKELKTNQSENPGNETVTKSIRMVRLISKKFAQLNAYSTREHSNLID